jgi:hypothetical protein
VSHRTWPSAAPQDGRCVLSRRRTHGGTRWNGQDGGQQSRHLCRGPPARRCWQTKAAGLQHKALSHDLGIYYVIVHLGVHRHWSPPLLQQ